jgi:hypothetical protein
LQSGPLSAGQVHWKPPSVLLQRADGWQVWVPSWHSSISATH